MSGSSFNSNLPGASYFNPMVRRFDIFTQTTFPETDWGGGVTTSKEFVSLLEERIATVVVEHWILPFVTPEEYESIKCHFYFNKTFVLQQGGVHELLVKT
ncbi:hypothetical protein TNCV_4638261 [Trichonephila clavipes]|uniref:Uncharacterized protein n=1 Tax=Trichonephila clavipes TaxID=2585209 RepID=A0A8X6WD99_TRICX|nr:hypothetical protein TNCV_4638261 [Trichonephila clavipes]